MARRLGSRLERGEVRLVSFAAPNKVRPALVLTRDSALDYLNRVTVAPITSSIRGVPSEVRLGVEDGMKRDCVVNLHHLATIPRNRLGRRVARLSDERMRSVCRAIGFALGCEDRSPR